MKLELIFNILYVLSGFIITAIPSAITIVKMYKQSKKAKSEAEAEAAKNAMFAEVNQLIASAETLYSGVDAILKGKGESAGSVKKDSVLTKLQAFALANGFDFDEAYWSTTIDEIVSMTKKVNAKK